MYYFSSLTHIITSNAIAKKGKTPQFIITFSVIKVNRKFEKIHKKS